MTESAAIEPEDQPALTLQHVSYTPGEIEGKMCLVIYNSHTDKTSIIGPKSIGYHEALAALLVLEVMSRPNPQAKKTVLHNIRKPKLILPGSNASN